MRPPTKMHNYDGLPVKQPTRRLTPGEARRWLVRHGGDRAYQPNAGHAVVAENFVSSHAEWSCRFSGWPQGTVKPLWYGVLTYRKPRAA